MNASLRHHAASDAPGIALCPAGEHGAPSYLLALPHRIDARTPLIVSVHGVTRQPVEHALAFAPLTRRADAILVVPFFSQSEHRRYPQLAHPRTGRRADLALIALLDSLLRSLGLGPRRIHLFGYSAGAQFAHRFAMAHPERVAALGLGAAGWYTMPDEASPYPAGLQGACRALGAPVDLPRFLRLPMRVWVGDRDDEIDASLRTDPHIIDSQGTSRIERAQRWVSALREAAAARGQPLDLELELLPRAGHSFTQCVRRADLAQRVMDFFLHRSPRALLLPEVQEVFA